MIEYQIETSLWPNTLPFPFLPPSLHSSLPPYQGGVDVASVGEVAVNSSLLADLGQHGIGSVHRLVQFLLVEGAGIGGGENGGKEGEMRERKQPVLLCIDHLHLALLFVK